MAAKKTAKKKTKSDSVDFQKAYWNHLLEHGVAPASVFKFCKELGVGEGDFFRRYASFDHLEAEFWESTVNEVIETLDGDEDTAAYDARQLLLAFYFTYFEHHLDHRSKFLLRFPSITEGGSARLEGFRRAFEAFAGRVVAQGRAEEQVADLKKLNQLQEKALYPQFRFLIDFHLKDSSQSFQETDALIEKSVRFFFDAAKFPIVESTIDLFRFLLPRMRQHS